MDLRHRPLGHAPEGETEHRSLPCHDVSRIDFDVASAAHRHDPPSISDHLQIVAKIYVRQHLDDDIDPRSVRYVANLLLIIDRSVIDRMMSTLSLYQLQAFVGSSRG